MKIAGPIAFQQIVNNSKINCYRYFTLMLLFYIMN